MTSPYDLETVILTLIAASTRVIPDLIENLSISSLHDTIVALNPVVTSFWLTIFYVFFQLLLSVITRSFAWNDRLWSLIPLPYAILYCVHPVISSDRRTNGRLDIRLCVMCTLVLIWSIRLTYNAARRGFYTPGFVDYRYSWIQQHVISSKVLFCVCYAFISCTYFSFMLALVVSPLYFAWIARGRVSFSLIDVIATASMILCLLLQTIADNQQYHFQKSKKEFEKIAKNKDGNKNETQSNKTSTNAYSQREITDGFLQSGLFAWSRHPNFFAEILIWWCFYLFSIATSGRWLTWAIIGPLLYTLLFQMSTPLTERISADKYPAYSRYQKCVSRLIPSPFSRSITSEITSEKKNE